MDDRTPGIRPRQTLGRRLDQIARISAPAVCTVLLMFLAVAPLGLPMQAVLLPVLTLGSVWFWGLHRPLALSPPLVFVLGVLFDLLGYLPLGTGVLSLLVAYAVAVRWRRFLLRQRFVVVWLAFALVAVALGLLSWALTSLLQFRLLPVGPALFQCGVTAAIYPGLSVLLARANGTIADPARA